MKTFADIARERGASVCAVRLFEESTGGMFTWHYWREKGGFLYESHDGEPRFSQGTRHELFSSIKATAKNYGFAIDETIVSNADKVELSGIISQLSGLPFLARIGCEIGDECESIAQRLAMIMGVQS